jgi:ribosomal protein S18 acetylase RimI-like enzyme
MPSNLARRQLLPIEVRRGEPEDIDALMALEHWVFATDQLSRRSMRGLLSSPTADVMVAERSGRLLGAAVVLYRAGSMAGRLYSIAVAPPMSGHGVGAMLLEAAESRAGAHGCRTMRLEVHESNAAAISRYRKSGYRQFGRHRAYYEDGGDALRFEKPIGISAHGLSRS